MYRANFGLALMAIALVAMGIIRVNHALNYQTVEAHVQSVTSECYLEDKTFMVVAERTRSTKQRWPCTRIEAVRDSDPELAGFFPKGYVEIDFDYVSPADQQPHDGHLSFAYADHPDYAAKSKGESVAILAHQSDAETYAVPD